MKRFILAFHCKDKKGIVAGISDYILSCGGNILAADQYSSDPENGCFFMRLEFSVPARCDKAMINKGFASVARSFHANWQLYDKSDKPRMGVLVSRPGHCLADLLYLWSIGELEVEIPLVISNYQGHKGLVEQYGLQFYFIAASRKERREPEILSLVKAKTDFLVLARYMLVLSGGFLKKYGRDIINIHHGFLPSFKGARPYHQAYDRGVKVIGATAHFVNNRLDDGPIIAQSVEPVTHRDSLPALIRKGRNLEKAALSGALHSYIEHRVIRYQNKTIVF